MIAATRPRLSSRSGNVQTCQRSDVLMSFTPKSFPINLFADPHPLTLFALIFYKNIGWQGAPPIPAVSDLQTSQRNNGIALSPLECAVPKKVGVGGKLLTRNPMRITVLRSIATKDLSSNPTKEFYPEGHRDDGPFLDPIKITVPSNHREAWDSPLSPLIPVLLFTTHESPPYFIASSLPQRTVTFPQHRTPCPLCSASPSRTIELHAGAKLPSHRWLLPDGSLNMSTPTGPGWQQKTLWAH